jgi:hypothetical protein
MDANWKVYEMNDCDWYAARTPEEAMEAMRENMGYKSVEELREDAMCESEPQELSDAALDELNYCLDERGGKEISFREQLNRMIQSGERLPGFFASTEF